MELGIWLRFQVNLEMSREQPVISVQCVSSDKHRNRCSKVFTESVITMPVHNQNNIYVLIHLITSKFQYCIGKDQYLAYMYSVCGRLPILVVQVYAGQIAFL